MNVQQGKSLFPSETSTVNDYTQRKAEKLVALYYFFFFLLSSYEANIFLSKHLTIVDPLWPIAWMRIFHFQEAQAIIALFALLGSLSVCIQPEKRILRIICFLGNLELFALINSLGKIDHFGHVFLLTSFILIFLPIKKGASEKNYKEQYLFIFWAAQTMTLLTYTMAGIWKLWGAEFQITHHQIHAFMPQAMAYQIAEKFLQANTATPLGTFFVYHPNLGWPMYVSALYLEFFSLYIAFKPSLHRIWALGLILMHSSIALTMGIFFYGNMLALGALLLFSPFSPANPTLQQVLVDLPIFGLLFRQIFKQ